MVVGGGRAGLAAAVYGASDGLRTLVVEKREPYMLESSLPGVFAAGDVRHGSPRGVAAAVADGAIAIRSAVEYLRSE